MPLIEWKGWMRHATVGTSFYGFVEGKNEMNIQGFKKTALDKIVKIVAKVFRTQPGRTKKSQPNNNQHNADADSDDVTSTPTPTTLRRCRRRQRQRQRYVTSVVGWPLAVSWNSGYPPQSIWSHRKTVFPPKAVFLEADVRTFGPSWSTELAASVVLLLKFYIASEENF